METNNVKAFGTAAADAALKPIRRISAFYCKFPLTLGNRLLTPEKKENEK